MGWVHLVLVGGLFVVAAVLLALAGLYFVRRVVPHHVLAPHNDVAGFVYATIAVTYAVILGFAVITVWEQFEEARHNADREANAVADLYRLAAWFPDTEKGPIQQSLIDYANSVVDDEWDAMNRSTAPDPRTAAELDRLWDLYRQAGEGSIGQSTAYDDSLDRLQDLGDARRIRLLESREGIPGIMWAGLIAGAVLTVGFAYGFGVERGQSHALMLATLAASISLLLFIVWSLDHAYRGDVRVKPEPFESFLRSVSGM
jgi:Protein of unknown function (DUF4239)